MKGNKTKILELCFSPNKGGLELYFANISNALANGFANDFEVLNVVCKGSKVAPLLSQENHVITMHKTSHYLPLVTAIKVANLIDAHDIKVIHIHWNHDLTVAVLAKLLAKTKVKLVLTRHMKFPAMKDSFFHKFLYKNIDHIFAITQTMANDLCRFIPDEVRPDISLNYLGVEPARVESEAKIEQQRLVYDPNHTNFLIVLVGRIDADKGHEFLLEALFIAKEKGLPFKALIVGHPMKESYLEQLKQRVNDLGLQERMIFTGFVDNPRALMQACDVLVLPTIEETFGLVLIEAMSVGVPVIGSNRGGVPEIIEDRVSGLLFESCNSQSLFDALYVIYAHPEMAEAYKHEALEVVREKFSAEMHQQRLVESLKELSNG